MLSSVLPTFKPIRCKLTELHHNQLLEIAPFFFSELKVPPFVEGERYCAVLLVVWRPYIREGTVQISAESNHGVLRITLIMAAS